MEPEKEKYLEFPGEVYFFLLRLLDDNKAPDGVKRRAIELCLEDRDFYRRVSRMQSEKWLKEQLTKKITTLITHRRTLRLCGVGAALVAGILVVIKPSPEKQSSPSPEHHNTVQNKLPVSPFSHESVLSQTMMPRYPNQPFRIEDFPGTTLDEKIKIFIRDRAALGDPTMKRIHDFMGGDTWEIYFCSPDEGQKLLAKHGKPLPPNMVVASASVWVIEASERKDGGKRGIGVVLLPPDDGIPEKLGIHRLAGTIANELTGVIVLFNNLTPPKEPGRFTISNDNTQYSAPEWMHQMAGMYVMQEALSHIIDLVEETRVATGNPQYMPSGDELWGALCQSLKMGKFDKNDPENYARVYFGIGLEKIGLEQDLILNTQYVAIMEHMYQRGVAFAIQEGNKEKFLTVLRSLGTIQ